MKTLFLHIGTHKTGTKALQKFLSVNYEALRSAGVLLPNAGRYEVEPNAFTPGQHVIAWELLSGVESPALDALIAEMDAFALPAVIVSSEEFHQLYTRPEALRTLAQRVGELGYGIKVIVYLRGQGRYAESLYSEYAKQSYLSRFEWYIDEILSSGTYIPKGSIATMSFEYSNMLSPFAQIFGQENVIARPYRPDLGTEHIFHDFFSTIASIQGALPLPALRNDEPVVNASLSFGTLLTTLRQAASRDHQDLAAVHTIMQERFASIDAAFLQHRALLLTHEDMTRFAERFRRDNELMRRQYGLELPFTQLHELPPPEAPLWNIARTHREILSYAIDRWNLN